MMKTIVVAVLSLCISVSLGVDPPVVVVENAPMPGHSYMMGQQYTLNCVGTPEARCTTQWLKDGVTTDDATSQIVVMVLPGQVQVKCTYICNAGVDTYESDAITLSGQNLMRVEVLNSGISGDHWMPQENSAVELSCPYQLFSDQFTKTIEERITPTVQWIVDGVVMETREALGFNAVPGYNKTVQCQVNHGTEELTSAKVTIESTDELDSPEVDFKEHSTLNDVTFFLTSNSYVAYCKSKSHSAGATYLWTRDYFTIPDAPLSRTFHLQSADRRTDDGFYRCRMRVESQEFCSKNAIQVEILDAGRVCQSDAQCTGDEYTQSCRNERCECAEGFEPYRGVCAGVSTLVASSVVLVCVFVLSRLL